jgi:hypothetical protein
MYRSRGSDVTRRRFVFDDEPIVHIAKEESATTKKGRECIKAMCELISMEDAKCELPPGFFFSWYQTWRAGREEAVNCVACLEKAGAYSDTPEASNDGNEPHCTDCANVNYVEPDDGAS